MNTSYSSKAKLYDKYRWSYPDDAIRWIIQKTNLNKNSKLCDVGAGTGKLAELFCSFVEKIYAVEPDDNMLEILKHKQFANVSILNVYSDSIKEISHGIIDTIIVAHALHWFNYPSTLLEFNRILKSGGYLVNVSNVYKETSDVNCTIEKEIEKYKKPITYHNRNRIVLNDYYSGYDEKEFSFSFTNDFESYLGGICSASYYPDESDGLVYYNMRNDIKKLFDEQCPTGKIEMKCGCIVQVGKLRKE
jgi:ubiquinone/menaquinone biosynthesis C-methylase UbiE